LLSYGLKGIAAYAEHAYTLGHQEEGIFAFIERALAVTLDDTLKATDLVALVLEAGKLGVDAGQCIDSYSLVVIALKLKEVFGLDDINQLPISYNIARYEQKAVIVLLALLYLGVKDIHLGPTLPGFLSPNVVKVLVDNFGIAGITDVDDDVRMFKAS
jgi:hydroxylamine reductase (hybrid-cluster protein)